MSRLTLVALVAVAIGCAHGIQPGTAACSASSVAAVIDSIASSSPSSSLADAAACWLELRRARPRLESAGPVPGHVEALESAISSGEGVADALIAADAAEPEVCRP